MDATAYGLGGRPLAYVSRSFIEARQKCVQIEEEMLAIVHGCRKFHHCILAQTAVTVETDHTPLQAIFTKPLHQCPMQLQRMKMSLQKHPLEVKCRPGKELQLPDALTIPSTRNDDGRRSNQVYAAVHLPISTDWLQEIRTATKTDDQLHLLHHYIMPCQMVWQKELSERPSSF